MSFWSDLSFTGSPYSTAPLDDSRRSSDLLVGRERELAALRRQITSADAHATLEGPSGFGKSSLVAVACHRLRESYRDAQTSQLFLPLGDAISVTPGMTPESLAETIVLDLAQAFVSFHGELVRAGLDPPPLGDLDTWLNDPVVRARGGGVSVLGSGGSVSRAGAPNVGGFPVSGLRLKVLDGLKRTFASGEQGGFVAVLDNVEQAGSPARARELLEAIRDPFLRLVGLRWVMCGARGVLRGACGSSRLTGFVARPIEIGPLGVDAASDVVEKRIEAFRVFDAAYGPVDGEGFAELFRLSRGNLRAALSRCQEFSSWAYDNDRLPVPPDPPEMRRALLRSWLVQISEEYVTALDEVHDTAWRLFDELVGRGGSARQSDLLDVPSGTPGGRKIALVQLEDASLVERWVVKDDKRRRSVHVTEMGWLINAARVGQP